MLFMLKHTKVNAHVNKYLLQQWLAYQCSLLSYSCSTVLYVFCRLRATTACRSTTLKPICSNTIADMIIACTCQHSLTSCIFAVGLYADSSEGVLGVLYARQYVLASSKILINPVQFHFNLTTITARKLITSMLMEQKDNYL